MNPVIVRNLKIGEGMPKICVPIVGTTEQEIVATAQEICYVPADLVEWRVDWFESVFEIEEVKKVLVELREVLGELPLLFTFRTKAEGGEKEITYHQYAELVREIAATKQVDFIDIEAFVDEKVSEVIADIQKQGVKVIGSNHDFAKTPEKDEIVRRLRHMQAIGVDISKIAVMPQSEFDVLTLLDASKEMASKYADRPIITMSMGGTGTISRISGELFGSAVTFGSLKKASAPGQIPVDELKEILEILHRVQLK